MFSLEFSLAGWQEYVYWQQYDRKQVKRINRILEECLKTPYEGIGKPEPLKWELHGYWSRRIDEEHRLVYTVKDKRVIVVSCRSHYNKN